MNDISVYESSLTSVSYNTLNTFLFHVHLIYFSCSAVNWIRTFYSEVQFAYFAHVFPAPPSALNRRQLGSLGISAAICLAIPSATYSPFYFSAEDMMKQLTR